MLNSKTKQVQKWSKKKKRKKMAEPLQKIQIFQFLTDFSFSFLSIFTDSSHNNLKFH